MAVISRKKQARKGPFVTFYEQEECGNHRLILELSDELLTTYCEITNTYLPFDSHSGGKLTRRQDIRLLAREFFGWATHLSYCRIFSPEIDGIADMYFPEKRAVNHQRYEAIIGIIREDMLDTAVFLGKELLKVAKRGNTLLIEGL